jgi:hypothetical protein
VTEQDLLRECLCRLNASGIQYMLSSVLRSERAVRVQVAATPAFVSLRRMLTGISNHLLVPVWVS